MKIGELAEKTGCTSETIRFYEQQGLLPEPTRTPGNYRMYSPAHLDRLLFIRHCRQLGLPHEEIRRLLELLDHPTNDCSEVDRLIDRHLVEVKAKIRDLNRLARQLANLRASCHSGQGTETCGILHSLAQPHVP